LEKKRGKNSIAAHKQKRKWDAAFKLRKTGTGKNPNKIQGPKNLWELEQVWSGSEPSSGGIGKRKDVWEGQKVE